MLDYATFENESDILCGFSAFPTPAFRLPPFLNRHRREAAVDVDRFAGDEAAGDGRAEQERRADQFWGVTQAAHRRVAKDRIDPGFVQDFAVLLGGKEARAQAVDADACSGRIRGRRFA